jgi:Na+/H+ antiporter NhaC
MAHATTQFPYALIAGGISFFIYIALGYMFA